MNVTHSTRFEGPRAALGRLTRDRSATLGLVIILGVFVLAIFGQWLAPYPGDIAGAISPNARLMPPSIDHWFGTNELGQDVLTLVLAGARISVFAGVIIVLLGTVVGTAVGAVSGYYGGWLDEILMRLTDLKMAIPALVLAMAVAAALGPGFINMIIAIALTWWPGYARLVRGEVMAKREEAFVLAGRACGASDARLLLRHILPNIVSPLIVKMSLDMGFAILTISSLGFVGLGVRPPVPEWGALLSVARMNMPDFWWTAIFPGAAIMVAVLGFNLLGDGLRDMFDPRKARK